MYYACARRCISLTIIKMNLLDIISVSTAALYAVPVVLYIITKDITQIRALIGLLLTLGVGESIKHHVIGKSSPRPFGARDCNLWCNDGAQSGKPGMPSGHSSQVTFFASFYYHQTKHPWIKNGLVVYALLVMLSRYLKRCHTLPQIIMGSLLGFVISKCVI
jgi:membrane-associated phospholipid phosphatase